MSSRPKGAALSWPGRQHANAVVTCPERLRVDIVDASQLCGEIADSWSAIRSQNLHLASPYFDPEFTKAVARVRRDVEIAIVRNGMDEIVSFLPYQRICSQSAEPVGGRLNDAHGIIADSRQSLVDVVTQVMRVARLRSFGFHAVPRRDPQLARFEFNEIQSHHIDLRDGWSAYKDWSRAKTMIFRRQGQKTRALERNVGPIRFEFDCTNAEALERLIELKREKYQRTKTFDILSVNWTSDLLREISNIDTHGFKGILSTLSAGDHLVAAHFGMISGNILHYWFPVFDPYFSKYSPGTELLLRVAQTASTQGIGKVDLGYGDDSYKYKFCNGTESMSCGKVVSNRLAFRLAKQQYKIRQGLKKMPLKPLAKSVLRGVFPGFGQWNFR